MIPCWRIDAARLIAAGVTAVDDLYRSAKDTDAFRCSPTGSVRPTSIGPLTP